MRPQAITFILLSVVVICYGNGVPGLIKTIVKLIRGKRLHYHQSNNIAHADLVQVIQGLPEDSISELISALNGEQVEEPSIISIGSAPLVFRKAKQAQIAQLTPSEKVHIVTLQNPVAAAAKPAVNQKNDVLAALLELAELKQYQNAFAVKQPIQFEINSHPASIENVVGLPHRYVRKIDYVDAPQESDNKIYDIQVDVQKEPSSSGAIVRPDSYQPTEVVVSEKLKTPSVVAVEEHQAESPSDGQIVSGSGSLEKTNLCC